MFRVPWTTFKGKTATTTFEFTSSFAVGDAIVARAYVHDLSGAPLEGAVVTLTVSGPDPATVTSGASDASGVAEATWNTSAPNKKGNGGTTPGTYVIAVSGVELTGYTWDGLVTTATISASVSARARG